MEGRATGMVVRVRPYSDTSLIVHWVTEEAGRLATLAKGARRPKSPLRGRLDLFFECSFSYRRSRRSELHTLGEVVVEEAHARLREEVGWLEQASYAAALVEQMTESDTPLPGVAGILRGMVAALPGHAPQARTVLAFELKLLRELGLEPWGGGGAAGGGLRLARVLAEASWEELRGLEAGREEARAVHRLVEGVLLQHNGRWARGRAEALAAGRGGVGSFGCSRSTVPAPGSEAGSHEGPGLKGAGHVDAGADEFEVGEA